MTTPAHPPFRGPSFTPSPADLGPDVDVLATRDGYDRWAHIYDDEDNPLIALEQPRVTELLGDTAGLTVADVGCGTGRHALRLAATGAKVIALDFSLGMLAKASAKAGADRVRFVVHDVADPLPLADRACDRLICCLVVEHVVDLPSLFREFRRVCKPDGFVVISAMHPAMMLRGITARFTDPETGRETRPQSHPNQISDFVMAAVRAEFTIDHLSEHPVDDQLVRHMERARRYLGWPMLLMMRLIP